MKSGQDQGGAWGVLDSQLDSQGVKVDYGYLLPTRGDVLHNVIKRQRG